MKQLKIDVKYAKIKSKEATGTINFGGINIDFISGKWGKGYAPKGLYYGKYFRDDKNPSFSLFGVGFFIYLEPMFKTDRKDLGIHFDGGDGSDGKKGYEGTLGCIGLKAKTKEDAIAIKNIFKKYFNENEILQVEIK